MQFTYQKNTRNYIRRNLRMRRIHFVRGRRLQIVLQTGDEQGHQAAAVSLSRFRLAQTRQHTRHADFHHRLVVGVVLIVRLADDGVDFGQNIGQIVDDLRISYGEQVAGARQIAPR